ncbi:MAG: hypothetical protein N838_16250 [Thiohalocapsa sp. PB-PSB1]|jgi:hypothetical protein|nr:MAG: hypothetical protein N838_16250 [Thiohalocapsa sp. PB-PSB1]
MPYTLHESLEHSMDDMTDDRRPACLERMSPEERLRGLSAEALRRLYLVMVQKQAKQVFGLGVACRLIRYRYRRRYRYRYQRRHRRRYRTDQPDIRQAPR